MKKFILLIVCFLLFTSVAFGEDLTMGKMSLEGEFLDGDLLQISIVADEMAQPVLGIAFTMNFDGQSLKFLKYEPGEFLERGGDPFYLVKNDVDKIFFGQTLRRDDSFPVGGGVVSKFYFQILDGDKFEFSFYNGVVSTLDVVRQDIDKILWEDTIVGRSDEKSIINLDYSKNSVVGSGLFNFSKILPWLFISAGAFGVFFVYFFSKKQEQKRP